jgi:catechol 2,3-dioxygenase-like lactoylglutathione lyase family enzyme
VAKGSGKAIGLHHIQLAMPPGEEEAAVKFYGHLLGMERIEKPPELASRGGVWFLDGDLEVHLGVEQSFQPADKAHPAFLVDSVERLRTRLEAAGFGVAVDEVQLEGFHRCYVHDPFGNRIELIEPI